MIKVFIVDDEAGARKNISVSLKNIQDVEILAEATNADEAIHAISIAKPDLIFLDVKMPQQSGFDLLDKLLQLGIKGFDVIFLTAHDEFAIQAIRYAAFDYLLKPIDMQELTEALIRFRTRKENTLLRKAENLKQYVADCCKIKFPTNAGLLFVDPSSVVYLEADGAYTSVAFTNGEYKLLSKNIGQLEEELIPMGFVRVHKSYVVNKANILGFLKVERVLVMKTETGERKIPVATRFNVNEL